MDTSAIAYIQAALGVVSLMIAIVFYMAWKTLGERPWALCWALAFASLTVYWFMHLSGSKFPNFESYWLVANAFGFATLTLALRGHCERTKCRILPANLWPISLLIFTGVMWTTLVDQNTGLSAAIFPITSAVSLLLASIMIIRHRPEPRPAEWASAISMTLFAVAQFPTAAFLYGLGPDPDVVLTQMFSHPSMLLRPAGLVGMGMFVIFMLASDLYEDMREIAVRDQLTGLYNRRGFGEQAAIAYANARRSENPVSVIAADIDHFKSVNDEFGHSIGDEGIAALRRAAAGRASYGRHCCQNWWRRIRVGAAAHRYSRSDSGSRQAMCAHGIIAVGQWRPANRHDSELRRCCDI